MSYLVQAGLFASGLVLGAGGAAVLSRSSSKQHALPQQQQQQQQGQQSAAFIPAPPPPGPPASAGSPATVVDSGNATGPAAAFANPLLGEIIGPGGHPGPISDLFPHAAYVSSYDRRLRHPAWTAEHLTAASLVRPSGPGSPDRGNSVFKEDERIPALFRARLADYFRSGYDRGHMVPAADAKRSQLAMNETFLLTNIAPQVGEGFNRNYWAHLEDFTRRLTSKFADVYVFTIPLYLPRQSADGKWRVQYEVIGNPPNVAVPTHFAKVILGVGKAGPPALPPPGATPTTSAPLPSPATALGLGKARDANIVALGAFVLPNSVIPDSAPLQSFIAPVETVERAAGLELFPPAIKSSSKQLCDTVACEVVIREFADKNRQIQQQGQQGGQHRRNSV